MKRITGRNSTVIKAPASAIWAILEDTQKLPSWCPIVKSVKGVREVVGAVRYCDTQFDGRPDKVTERCVEAVPNQRISWIMEEGFMTKIFSHVQMGFVLEGENDATKVTCFGQFQPRNILALIFFKFLMERKMAIIRQQFLSNLKTLAETLLKQPSVG